MHSTTSASWQVRHLHPSTHPSIHPSVHPSTHQPPAHLTFRPPILLSHVLLMYHTHQQRLFL